MRYWCIKDGINEVNVRPVQQQRTNRLGPVTVYRSSSGITYSAKHIRAWEELTAAQKIKAYRDAYQANRYDAIWQITKDPTLEPQYPAWIDQLKRERDEAISAIERGETVDPPRRIWE